MSAQFLLKFREHYVRIVERESTIELVAKHAATVFSSEPEAWLAASRQDLQPEEWISVEALR